METKKQNYKFELSPTQIKNLQNRNLRYQNGKEVYPTATREQKLTFENVATFLIGCIFGSLLLNGLYLVITNLI